MELPKRAWRRITWREGTNTPLVSRFAAVRVRPAHRDYNRTSPRPEEWCLIEWPKGEAMPTKYWLSTLPEDTRLRDLVDLAKLRWRIERDYQELNRNSASATTRVAAGAAFTITQRSPLPPMDSCSPRGRRFPPQDHAAKHRSKRLLYPKVTDPAVPPIRPERHVSNSIATVQIISPAHLSARYNDALAANRFHL